MVAYPLNQVATMSETVSTALLLIDIQASFTSRPYWSDAEVPAFLAACNALIDGCTKQGVPIVQVFHTDGPCDSNNPFAVASGLIRPLDGLHSYTPALSFHKHRHSALVGTGLADWLKGQGITRLIVAGIRTEQCCETTTRHASDEGWDVDYVTEATLTFDMLTPAGTVLTAAAIKERTETVLTERFATLCTVSAALTRAQAAA